MADLYGFGESIQHSLVLFQPNRIKVSFRETANLDANSPFEQSTQCFFSTF